MAAARGDDWVRVRQGVLVLLLFVGCVPAVWGVGAILEDLRYHDDWLDGLGVVIGGVALAVGVTVSGVSACGLAWPSQTWRALRWTGRFVILPLALVLVVFQVLGTVLA